MRLPHPTAPPCPYCGTLYQRCSYDDAREVSRCGITGKPLPVKEDAERFPPR